MLDKKIAIGIGALLLSSMMMLSGNTSAQLENSKMESTANANDEFTLLDSASFGGKAEVVPENPDPDDKTDNDGIDILWAIVPVLGVIMTIYFLGKKIIVKMFLPSRFYPSHHPSNP